MIPVLYDPFDLNAGNLPQHLGKGLLTKTTECIVTMDEGYAFDLSMKIPILAGDSLVPKIFDMIKVDCGMDNPQYFEIQSIDKNTNGRERDYYAWHISRRAAFEVVNVIPEIEIGFGHISPEGGANIIKASLNRPTKFQIHCEITESTMKTDYPYFSNLKPAPLFTVLTEYANMLGARLEFDNYDIYIKPKIDHYHKIRVTSRRNLLELADGIDGVEAITGYAPYWTSKQNGVEKVEEYGYHDLSGNIVPYNRYVPYDLRARFPGQADDYQPDYVIVETMIERVLGETVSDTVRTMNLNYHEIQGQKIRLYDAIDIYCPEIEIDESRPVVKVVYDVLRERNEGITVGTLQPNLTKLVSASSNPREIGSKRKIN